LLIGNLSQSQEVTPSSPYPIMHWLLESAGLLKSDSLANFCAPNGDLEEQLFYRACASPHFYTAKTLNGRSMI
jgi:hypothetical protein